MQLHNKRSTRVPSFDQCHCQLDLQWPREHGDWAMDKWKVFAWWNESRFLIHHVDGRVRVHRLPGLLPVQQVTNRSVMLLFQVSFPCLLFANGPSELHFRGGTNADMAPQIDHTIMVFKPLVEKLGAKFNCNIVKRGYYPKGGGEVVISVTPVSKHLNPIELLKPAEVVDIKGRSFVAGVLPVKVAHGMADAASRCLRAAFPGIPMKIDRVKESPQEAEGNGSGIVLVAKTASGCLIGGSALGKRGVQADAVGETAAKEILEDVQNQACVDRHVQDQLVIFMALAKGQSKVVIGKPTLHTETAIYIAELMTEVRLI
ncbi:RNA 3'-terminal phosphate cyclase-like, partial [Stegodyphus dumicola]|uniref:RNA 3'-terminal phosphate cyclase-like n=1 Tax=Stegodyphus dumicola TaxID=202533 RepID=UPI0015AA1702